MIRTPLKRGDNLQLNNRQYTIEKVIGDGATCIVYSAYYSDNMGHSHYVNIKECYPYNANITRNEQALSWPTIEEKENNLIAFRNAYEKLMDSQNGNFTVHAFDICESNETLYIIMDANNGVTFDKDTADTLADVLKTVRLLAHVVGNYHSNGYLHLDIKPSNFLVYPRPSEHIVLFDMDTVTSVEDVKNGNVKGVSYSDGWAAPEQKQGKISKLCPATDIYAIGAILFEKIMGRQVEASDLGVFADWDFEGEKFENINPKIKRLLRNIFEKTLSANIKRRYQSTELLIKDLESAIIIAESKVYLKGDDVCCNGYFVGREQEIKQIKDSFDLKKKAVLLHGFGGIGKTEIARKYAELYRRDYDVVLFIKYDKNSTLSDKLNEVAIINFEADTAEHNRTLCNLLDDKTLVIVDNFDIEIGTDNGLKMLLDTKAHVVVSTRTDFSAVYNGERYVHIEVGALASSELEQVFIRNAKINLISDHGRVMLGKIFKLIQNHTYATELLAKQMYYSGWTLEFLYEKLRLGFASLENTEKFITNKDENAIRDNSLNILRAVYNVSDLTEGQQQVLRDMTLLNFVKITKEAYREIALSPQNAYRIKRSFNKYEIIEVQTVDDIYSKMPEKTLNSFNELFELGYLQRNGNYFSLHSIIEEIVLIDLVPQLDNCAAIHNYIFRSIDWFSNEDKYTPSPAKQAEAENKAIFLLRFFEALDLNNTVNLKLILKWLKDLFESSFYIMNSMHIDSKLTQLYCRLETVNNLNDTFDKFELFSVLFKVWLYRCNFFFLAEKDEKRKQLEICEKKATKFYELSLACAEQLDGTSTGAHTKEIIADIACDLEKSEAHILFEKEVYGGDITCEQKAIIGLRIPASVIQKAYNLMPEMFNISADTKKYFDLPLTDDDLQELNCGTDDSDTLLGKPDESVDEWISLCDAILNDFRASENKGDFLNALPKNKEYTPSQKVSLLEELLDKAFGEIMWAQSKKNRAASEKLFNETNWAFIGEILNLQCIIAANAEESDYEWCEVDLEYLSHIPKYRTILSAIFDLKKDFSEWIQIVIEKDGAIEHSTIFNMGYDFNVGVSNIITACEIMHKCRYVLPYITRELMNWLSDLDEDNCDNSINDYFMAIETTAECAKQALEEIDDTDESFEMYVKIRDWATALLDSITNKTFELKDDTEE